jgi:hypothetical protein
MSYGMPHRRGWKPTGVLYADDSIEGAFATNGDEWIADWYTRGAPLCPSGTSLLLLDMTSNGDDAAELISELDRAGQSHSVQVDGEERLALWQHAWAAPPVVVDAAEVGHRFDSELAALPYPISPRTASPALEPLEARFANGIVLEGGSLFAQQVHPGETIDLTLRWTTEAPVDTHFTLSLQMATGENRKLAQLDAMPSCDAGPTSDWEIGEEIYGRYRLRVAADAPPGRYPLVALLYDAQSLERLSVVDGAGAPVAEMVEVAQVEIVPGD